jgi:predicted ribosomally synthesized peptide with SipW-like signal peptide
MTKQEKKKDKRRRRKILLALLLVVFTGIILTANTYAWFTSNKTITVEAIDVQVATANGIQVSVDGVNWKTIITNADLNSTLQSSTLYTTNTNQLPFRTNNNTASTTVKPVSTGGTIADDKLNMYLGELASDASGNTILKSTKSTEAKRDTGDFVAFDLFFMVTQNSTVKLGKGSEVSASTGATNRGLKNAARAAFIKLGKATIGSNASTIQGIGGGTDMIMWEPNNNVHTDAAIADALSTYNLSITNTTQVNSYYGVDAVLSTGVSLKDLGSSSNPIGTNFKSVTPTLKTPDGALTDDQNWFSLDAGITKVRFYLWIEGQDVDCENTASGDAITYNMNFVLV